MPLEGVGEDERVVLLARPFIYFTDLAGKRVWIIYLGVFHNSNVIKCFLRLLRAAYFNTDQWHSLTDM